MYQPITANHLHITFKFFFLMIGDGVFFPGTSFTRLLGETFGDSRLFLEFFIANCVFQSEKWKEIAHLLGNGLECEH